jgi:hypothetical protein
MKCLLEREACVSFSLPSSEASCPHFSDFVQIAMSLRDTTTDENELAMRYTILRSECAEVGARLGATSLLQI